MAVIKFLKSIPELWVFIISMVPFIELRGAIPVGTALGLPFYYNFTIAVISNMIPVPFILLLIPKILEWLGKFKFFAPLVNWLRSKAENKKGKIIGEENSTSLSESGKMPKMKMTPGIFAALMLFVGIPLPGTGAWSGALIASLFNIQKRWSILAIFLGVLLAGVIMTLGCYGVVGFFNIFA